MHSFLLRVYMNVNTPPHPTHPITSTWFASASTKRVKIGSSFHPAIGAIGTNHHMKKCLARGFTPASSLIPANCAFIAGSKMKAQRPIDPTDAGEFWKDGRASHCFWNHPILTHSHSVRMDKPTLVPNQWFHMECSPIEESDPRWHFFSRNEGSGFVERQGSLLWFFQQHPQ